MEWTLLLEYGWVLIILIILEGILAADNAVVLAMMVKHLPEKQRKRALFYGLAGAFIFRLAALAFVAILIEVWQVQAIGALYLLFIAINHFVKKYVRNKTNVKKVKKQPKQSGFWMTVLKVELADIAFAVDSILAAVALAMTLTPTGWFTVGPLDGAQFVVVFIGGLTGVIIMRFAAGIFIRVLENRPGLENGAYLIVGWVGVKLAVFTLAHPSLAILPEHFPESTVWKLFFWGIMALIIVLSWLLSAPKLQKKSDTQEISHL
ncbi:TerC family protein [Geomicrobium sp. JCM 19039]|uniref:TerC family protein n=1 Tax=Geomicrobium sp. JCM 19039 TaxID=1460636 RepID=UPI00045F3502|nr:TerC family protein [Geomicrobium sp. JCM 19039]GAK11550.1 TerC-like integral membrane protein [Geomicrobium sp. JCM 19039]